MLFLMKVLLKKWRRDAVSEEGAAEVVEADAVSDEGAAEEVEADAVSGEPVDLENNRIEA